MNKIQAIKCNAGCKLMNQRMKNFVSSNKNELPEYIVNLINRIENSNSHKEVLDVLFQSVKNQEMEIKNGVLFKQGEYIVQNAFKNIGALYEKNLKTVNKLGLNITPKLVTTITKDNDMFLIYKIEGTKNGDLIPYSRGKQKVSKNDKLAAYQDFQKLTKAGLIDDKIVKSPEMWYVTPDDNKIMLPSFEALRSLKPGENQSSLTKYYNIIFDEKK